MGNPELAPLRPAFDREDQARAERLLASVFEDPKFSSIVGAYDAITPERVPSALLLSDPIPFALKSDFSAFTERLPLDSADKSMMQQFLFNGEDRASVAEGIVFGLSEVRNRNRGAIPFPLINEGISFLKRVTNFNLENISESTLADILPTSSFPRRVDYAFFLLRIREDFLAAYQNGLDVLSYDVADDSSFGVAKTSMLTKGLQLVPQEVVIERSPGKIENADEASSLSIHTFTKQQVVEAFRALTSYDLRDELASSV